MYMYLCTADSYTVLTEALMRIEVHMYMYALLW